MKIYNTFTRKKEEFKPVVPGHVGMYVCGPTVYGLPHLGHAKCYISFDLIYRTFKFLGYKVKYVQNITDVGHLVGDGDDGQDKIGKQAALEKLDAYEIAYKYEVEHFRNMDKLNVLRPSISCRATGFVQEMIEAVEEIVKKGYGYVTKEGNVYFDVHKYKNYGQLSNRTLDKTLSGERIEVAGDKKHNEDFALWKSVDPNTLMKWNSPWGVGCPGWHMECTVLGKKFLGTQFDIHGGGLDNIFPHHECECAQADVLNGHIPMNYFMHNGLVTVNGAKMGKSMGNFITLPDLFKKYDPMVVRYFTICSHYRSNIDFSDAGLNIAKAQFEKIEESVAALRQKTKETKKPVTVEIVELFNKIVKAMEDDFNTPVAISEFIKLPKMIKAALDLNDIASMQEINFIIEEVGKNLLGLEFKEIETKKDEQIPAEIVEAAKARWIAKQSKNWAVADEMRAKIDAAGYVIRDKADGYDIVKK